MEISNWTQLIQRGSYTGIISGVRETKGAAQKEVDARQETLNAQRKERFKQTIARINGGTGTCMGYMALRPEEKAGDPAEQTFVD